MIAHLLSTGSVPSHNGTSGQLQIGTTVVLLTWDEEELLLQPNVGNNVPLTNVQSEMFQKTLPMLIQGGVTPQQGSLFIQSRTVITNKRTGNKDRIPPQKDGTARIHGEVSSGRMSRAQTSVGVGTSVGLPLDEIFALKVEFDVVGGSVEFHHHVLDLAGLSVTNSGGGHGLEPVAVGVGSTVYGPVDLIVERERERISIGKMKRQQRLC